MTEFFLPPKHCAKQVTTLGGGMVPKNREVATAQPGRVFPLLQRGFLVKKVLELSLCP